MSEFYYSGRKFKPGFIYFARIEEGGGLVKVGFSTQPRARLSSLQAWCPFKIEIITHCPSSHMGEQMVLDRCRHLQVRGEWFRPGDPLENIIAHVVANNALPQDIAEVADEWLAVSRKAMKRDWAAERSADQERKRSALEECFA